MIDSIQWKHVKSDRSYNGQYLTDMNGGGGSEVAPQNDDQLVMFDTRVLDREPESMKDVSLLMDEVRHIISEFILRDGFAMFSDDYLSAVVASYGGYTRFKCDRRWVVING